MATTTPEQEKVLDAIARARDAILRAERERDSLIATATRDDGPSRCNLRAIAQVAGLSHESVRKIAREMADVPAKKKSKKPVADYGHEVQIAS